MGPGSTFTLKHMGPKTKGELWASETSVWDPCPWLQHITHGIASRFLTTQSSSEGSSQEQSVSTLAAWEFAFLSHANAHGWSIHWSWLLGIL